MKSSSQKSGSSNQSEALQNEVRTNLLSRLLFMMLGDSFERPNSKGEMLVWAELEQVKMRSSCALLVVGSVNQG